MKITTGINDFEVLSSGTIISFKEESINFELSPQVKVILRFVEDKEVKEQKMDFKVINNNQIEILLTNFNNSLGTANVEPLELAIINNKKIYFNFVVYSLSGTVSKTVHYTWYAREEAKND
jgi:ABC-type sulfate/molybdate transport systems ATPase subunit